MEMTLGNVAGLVRLTFAQPRQAAQVVLRLPLPLQARWAAVALMAVLSAFVVGLKVNFLPKAFELGAQGEMQFQPLFLAPFFAVGMTVVALLAYSVGRWRGGKGDLADALLLVAWLQFIQVLFDTVDLLFIIVFQASVPLLLIGALVFSLWLSANFLAEMHGFQSLGLVFLGIVLTLLAVGFGIAVLLLLMGGGF